MILNQLGLHARPAAKFVKLSSQFASNIWVEKEQERVNGKSIMGLMMLAAGRGAEITVVAEGSDAEEAVEAIESLVDSQFGEGN